MPISSTTMVISALLFIALTMPAAAASIGGGDDFDFGWMTKQPAAAEGGCRGSIGDCMSGELEMQMESESTRRILATSNYISYGALQGNNVPCSQRGASYYNCQAGGQANPYQRGCSTITRCQR